MLTYLLKYAPRSIGPFSLSHETWTRPQRVLRLGSRRFGGSAPDFRECGVAGRFECPHYPGKVTPVLEPPCALPRENWPHSHCQEFGWWAAQKAKKSKKTRLDAYVATTTLCTQSGLSGYLENLTTPPIAANVWTYGTGGYQLDAIRRGLATRPKCLHSLSLVYLLFELRCITCSETGLVFINSARGYNEPR